MSWMMSTRCLLAGIVMVAAGEAQTQDKPKLILQITVDQLRGDLPTRYFDRLGCVYQKFYPNSQQRESCHNSA